MNRPFSSTEQTSNLDPQFNVDYDIRKFSDEFSHLKNGDMDKSRPIQLAGRIFVRRSAGSKLFFYDIRSDVGTNPCLGITQTLTQLRVLDSKF